jgi:hypothetical protein
MSLLAGELLKMSADIEDYLSSDFYCDRGVERRDT